MVYLYQKVSPTAHATRKRLHTGRATTGHASCKCRPCLGPRDRSGICGVQGGADRVGAVRGVGLQVGYWFSAKLEG